MFLSVGFPFFQIREFSGVSYGASRAYWFALVSGAMLAGVIGGLDDYRGLPARVRFVCQAAAAMLMIGVGIRWRFIDFGFGELILPFWVSVVFSLLWLVWNTNLYNFMDGIDGIAGLNGVVLSLAIAAIGWILGFEDIFLAAIVMVPCLVAFLVFNLPKARIFMGDSGSLPLGFAFSALVMALHNRAPGVFTFWHGVLLIGPFFFDATYTLLRRMWRREKFWAAHRDHIYQKLARRTGSHLKVAILYTFLAAGTAGSVVWMIAVKSGS
jgi:UDP-N-acetylmuramyl pentapeptide phosphotransferase/UDP-N-acetylglucosamine-1-phosphate transferase